jgi:hypothetical protein
MCRNALYMHDFYQGLRSKLAPGGIFVTQAGPGAVFNCTECFSVIHNTLRQSFGVVVSYTVDIPSFGQCGTCTCVHNFMRLYWREEGRGEEGRREEEKEKNRREERRRGENRRGGMVRPDSATALLLSAMDRLELGVHISLPRRRRAGTCDRSVGHWPHRVHAQQVAYAAE